jgi:hypothetical protein
MNLVQIPNENRMTNTKQGQSMPEMTPGTALRQLKQAHAILKKARQLMKQARENPQFASTAFDTCWESLAQAHRLMGAIPRSALDEPVLTQQLSVQRYATSLLVRMRRLMRNEELEPVGDTDTDDDLGDDDNDVDLD